MSQGHMFHGQQGEDSYISEHIDWLRVRGDIVQREPLWPAAQGCSGTIAGCSWVQGMGGDALMRDEWRANEYMGESGSLWGGLTVYQCWGITGEAAQLREMLSKAPLQIRHEDEQVPDGAVELE